MYWTVVVVVDTHTSKPQTPPDNLHTSIMGKAEAAETSGDESSVKVYKASA